MQNLNFEKLVTKTGVPLYVMSLPYASTVAAGVLVKAGTRDEQWPQEAGLAHALEHMIYIGGTKHFPTGKELTGYIEEVGGYSNAWTTKEATFFYAQVPVQYKERAVHIIGETITNSIFPAEKISTEMKNIVEEIRRSNDDADHLLYDLAMSFLYNDHPLGRKTLGTIESVSSFGKLDFERFRNKYYCSENYAFVCAGNIEPDEALGWFEQYFPNIQTESHIPNVRSSNPLRDSGERLHIRKKQLDQVHLVLTVPIGKREDTSSEALEIYRSMIDGGASFPLFQEVRDKRGLCYEIGAEVDKNSDIGNFSIGIGTDPTRYQEAIDRSLAVIQENKTDATLLRRAQELILGRLALRYENTGNIINIAASDILDNDKPFGYEQLKERIESISIADVTNAVDTYLRPEQFRCVLLVPESLNIKT